MMIYRSHVGKDAVSELYGNLRTQVAARRVTLLR
jgi:hypothetical protein